MNKTGISIEAGAEKFAQGFLVCRCFWSEDGDLKQDDWKNMNPDLYEYLIWKNPEKYDITLRYWRGEFYLWNRGCYEKLSDSEMKSMIVSHLKSTNDNSSHDVYHKYVIQIRGSLVNDILLCLAGTEEVHIAQSRELNTWKDNRNGIGVNTISFNNGLINVYPNGERSVLLGHTPDYFSMNRIPYDFIENADCPKWMKFLDEITGGDLEKIRLLAQWAGYLIMNDLRFQKFMMIVGDGSNGKTVFTTMLEKMIGMCNVSHVPLSMLSRPFSLAATLGKMLNSTSESTQGLDETAETYLKSFTSGDSMTFERKFKEPVHIVPTAKMMISTNNLPRFCDKSHGLWRRMILVKFDRYFPENMQNKNLMAELSEELPGIFNWAYKGLLDLKASNGFAIPQQSILSLDQYRDEMNPARAFLRENFIYSRICDGIQCMDLYSSYSEWCMEHGCRRLSSQNMGKEVKRMFPDIEVKRCIIDGRRVNKYASLEMREDSLFYYDNLTSKTLQRLPKNDRIPV